PDNPELRKVTTDTNSYVATAALNSLFYELTGAIFTNREFRTLVGQQTVKPAALESVFNVSGIQNSARNRHDIPYKGFSIKAGQHAELNRSVYPTGGDRIEVLRVPVPGRFQLEGEGNTKINPWFYDSSTTNRHNKAGFDLWA